MNIRRLVVSLCLAFALVTPAVADEGESAPSLYERLGGATGIDAILDNTLERHLANPLLAPYFQHLDREWFKQAGAAFFAAGTGGPNNYAGRDVVSAHAHLRIGDEVFDAAIADILVSVEANGADQATRDEVAAILESFRVQVVTQ